MGALLACIAWIAVGSAVAAWNDRALRTRPKARTRFSDLAAAFGLPLRHVAAAVTVIAWPYVLGQPTTRATSTTDRKDIRHP